MKIQILQLIEGSKQAKGLTVIIDVFRAFSVEAYLASRNVDYIIPVGECDEAYSLKKQHPEYLLCGERDGKMLPGFDYGNSPSVIVENNFRGRVVVHTTSAGIQGIVNAFQADEIITGSLVNAKAIAEYIQKKRPEYVSLVCMGLAGKEECDEDTLCAKYIQSLLENKKLDLENEIERLKYTSGAKFFDPKQQSVFPQKDFELSTQVNCFDFVLKVEDWNGQKRIIRIE